MKTFLASSRTQTFIKVIKGFAPFVYGILVLLGSVFLFNYPRIFSLSSDADVKSFWQGIGSAVAIYALSLLVKAALGIRDKDDQILEKLKNLEIEVQRISSKLP